MKLTTRLLVASCGLSSLAQCADRQQPLFAPASSISQPYIGFGTWNLKLSEENTTEAVSFAIQTGYRQIDCAAAYGNEKAVGKGIADGLKKANITREEIWVTSKLWNDHHEDPALVEAGLKKTLDDLDLEYLDLYLMHWPVGSESKTTENHEDYIETWRSMIALPTSNVHHLGISNFSPQQLREIISKTGVKPYAQQMELHPYLQQTSWIATHKALGISVTAYSPLGNSNPVYKDDSENPPPLLKNDLLVRIGERIGCTPAQVSLSWGITRGTSVIPKSSHREHIEQNLGALDCELGVKDLGEITLMEKDYVKRFNNPSKNWGVKLFDGLQDA